jgi:hypothetical protein
MATEFFKATHFASEAGENIGKFYFRQNNQLFEINRETFDDRNNIQFSQAWKHYVSMDRCFPLRPPKRSLKDAPSRTRAKSGHKA